MLNILTAAFVAGGGLFVFACAVWVISQDARRKPAADELASAIEEAVVPERPEWLYGQDGRARAMAIPGKRPALRTRSAK